MKNNVVQERVEKRIQSKDIIRVYYYQEATWKEKLRRKYWRVKDVILSLSRIFFHLTFYFLFFLANRRDEERSRRIFFYARSNEAHVFL